MQLRHKHDQWRILEKRECWPGVALVLKGLVSWAQQWSQSFQGLSWIPVRPRVGQRALLGTLRLVLPQEGLRSSYPWEHVGPSQRLAHVSGQCG